MMRNARPRVPVTPIRAVLALIAVAAAASCGSGNSEATRFCDCAFACPSQNLHQTVSVQVCATGDDAPGKAETKCKGQFKECADAACTGCSCRESSANTACG